MLIMEQSGFLVVTGGVGTYKTTGCIIILYLHLIANKTARIMVLMQTDIQLDLVFVHEWEKVVPKDHYTEIKSKKYWSYKLFNGAEVVLQYAEHTAAHDRIVGANLTGYYISQAETLTFEDLVTQLELRKRGRKRGEILFRIIDANGGNPTRPALDKYVEHDSDRFVCRKGGATLYKDYGNMRWYRGTTIEGDPYNHLWIMTTPETSEYTAEELEQYKITLSVTDHQRMIEGKNVSSEGLIYKAFDRNVHVTDFEINKDARWYCGVDWGYVNPAVCLFTWIDSDDHVWVYDEIYVTEVTTEPFGKLINTWLEEHGLRPRVVYCDPSSKGNIATFQEKKIRLPAEKGYNGVDDGIKKVRSWLQSGKLHVHERCINTIREFTSYEAKKAMQGNSKTLEIPKKENDHAMDALRYIIATLWR